MVRAKLPAGWAGKGLKPRLGKRPRGWDALVAEQAAAVQECADAFARVQALTAAGAAPDLLEHAHKAHGAARNWLENANRALQVASGQSAHPDADF